MKTTIEIKSLNGRILFSFKKENNTLKDTVIEAVKNKVSLRNANLQGINLQGANLQGAELSGANLRGADLSKVDLSYANLQSVDFHNAYLCSSNFSYSNFRGADLNCAYLNYANFSCANLCEANLYHTNCNYTNFDKAYLIGTCLYRAHFNDVNNIPFIPTYLPEGEFIGWKKLGRDIIVKLKILEDSKRSRSTTEKCRCDKALVLEFQNLDGNKSKLTEFVNTNYVECEYRVGEIVHADKWDSNRWDECSNGIHFFIDRQSAVGY